MIPKLLRMFVFGVPLLAILYHTDHLFGYSVIDFTRKVFSKHSSFTTIFTKERTDDKILGNDTILALQLLLTEFFVISVTVAIINKLNQYRPRDNLHKLVDVGKKALKQSDEIIEKWRQQGLRNTHIDDETQDATPSIIEVPLLHMAILDALGNTRSQHERGDSGDTFNVAGSALVFSSTLLDDDLNDSNPETEGPLDEKPVEVNSRLLWDVIEEDFNSQ